MEDFGHRVEIGGQEGHHGLSEVIACREVDFSYKHDPFNLRIPYLSVTRGSKIALVGPSGCGKTTLINLFAGILSPNAGSVVVDGIDITKYSERDRADFRIARLGLVFQEFELLDYLSVLDNVLLPYRINPIMRMTVDAHTRAQDLCRLVGLADQMHKRPGRMSQGERQRVAVCRALVTEPALVLGDEPTANLDPKNRDNILDIIFDYCNNDTRTLVMVTHDAEVVRRFSEVIEVSNYTR